MTEPLQPPPRSLFEPLIRAALAEDLAGGVDVTSEATIPADLQGVARGRVRHARRQHGQAACPSGQSHALLHPRG